MRKFLTPGVALGLLALAGTAATASGYPVLGAFLSDPNTASTASAVLNGLVALAAGVANGVKAPAA